MTAADALDRGREPFVRRKWGDVYTQLSAADRDSSLEREDLEQFAIAAYLVGRDEECADLWSRAYRAYLDKGETTQAARCAFWLGFGLFLRGEVARGGGWLARARRVLETYGRDCVEQGYLLVPVALERLGAGDPATAYTTFDQAAAIAERFGDRNLMAIGLLGRGQALIYLGEVAEGVTWLDEAMVAVTADEITPIVSGIVYCAMIQTCQAIFDLRRAQEWTTALSRWCASQPGLVPFRGQCLAYRAEIMRIQGAWSDALDEARRACELLSGHPSAGTAYYQLGELHRLCGEFDKAESAFREASRWGSDLQPGLAMLRLAEEHIESAAAMTRRAVNEARDHVSRSHLLSAHAEIMLAAGDIPAARAAATELLEIAKTTNSTLLHAIAHQIDGAVSLAEGGFQFALTTLRQAWMTWKELEAPYGIARTRELIGIACRQLGDEDSAAIEFDAALRTFHQLGAAPDLHRVTVLCRTTTSKANSGLTARELEVLCLVASGKSNRTIANDLFISEKTVGRHISNIFSKLGLSNRAAATAYAYEHGLR